MPLFNPTKKKKKSAGGPETLSLFNQRLIQPVSGNVEQVHRMAPWWNAAAQAATTSATALGAPEGPLYGQLESEASSDLALGGDLSDDEVREVTQGERAAWQARGLHASAPAAFSEVLRRMQFSNQRKAERRGFASSVANLGLQRQGALSNTLGTLTAGNIGTQALAEEQRIADLTRDDTLKFNDKRIAADIKIGEQNAKAAKSAGKSSMFGSIIGGIFGAL